MRNPVALAERALSDVQDRRVQLTARDQGAPGTALETRRPPPRAQVGTRGLHTPALAGIRAEQQDGVAINCTALPPGSCDA
jgi:hypothetical protein